jgi:hypothetical protein
MTSKRPNIPLKEPSPGPADDAKGLVSSACGISGVTVVAKVMRWMEEPLAHKLPVGFLSLGMTDLNKGRRSTCNATPQSSLHYTTLFVLVAYIELGFSQHNDGFVSKASAQFREYLTEEVKKSLDRSRMGTDSENSACKCPPGCSGLANLEQDPLDLAPTL